MARSLDSIIEDLDRISSSVCDMHRRPLHGRPLTLSREIDGIVAELRGITAKMDMLLDEIEKGIIPVPGEKQQ